LPREGIEQITVHDEEEEWRYDREVDEAPLDDAYEWREGQMVRHPDYGTGQIQALEWTGRGTRARVRFKAIGDMTIYLQYSNLEPLEFEEMD
jgi:hypothetical protein